jgi:hypothetical protein
VRGDFVPSATALADRHLDRQGPQFKADCEKRARMRPGRLRRFYSDAHLRLAWEHAGADPETPHVEEMIARGLGPVNYRMPTGASGAAFMRNLPPAGTYSMNTEVFSKNTERNDVPQKTEEYPGFGGTAIDIPIAKVGVLSGCQIAIEATVKTGGAKGTITPTFRWPWGLIKSGAITANGQTSLIRPSGLDMRARHSRVFRNPRDPISVAPSIDERGDPTLATLERGKEFSVFIIYEVPIVHDWYTITGSLFMQSDQTYAALHLEFPSLAELFTLTEEATVELVKPVIKVETTTFDVPFATTSKGDILLVPNLQWLHGFISNQKFFSNNGDVEVPLVRVSGELLAVYMYIVNGSSATISPASLEQLRMEYGANRIPRNYKPVQHFLQKNADDYNGLLLPNAGYMCWDYEADNPSRDLVFPKGVTELKIVPTIAASVSIKANSAVQFAEEALFAGR